MALDFPDGQARIVAGQFTLAGSGHTSIAVTGTPLALRAATTIQQVAIRADRENVGTIYVGISTVTGDNTALLGGFHLYPGDAIVFPETDLAHVFINGAAGDGVSYQWWT